MQRRALPYPLKTCVSNANEPFWVEVMLSGLGDMLVLNHTHMCQNSKPFGPSSPPRLNLPAPLPTLQSSTLFFLPDFLSRHFLPLERKEYSHSIYGDDVQMLRRGFA